MDNQAAIKKLMNKIPTDKGAVFAYPIKWEAYDKFSFSMAPKLSQWVLKKTKELLGEEELSMVEYVMNMLKEHVQVSNMMCNACGAQPLLVLCMTDCNPFHDMPKLLAYAFIKASYCKVVMLCVQPGKMMETLSSVMDNETQPFVLKLFRMVIFETEKAALGIVE